MSDEKPIINIQTSGKMETNVTPGRKVRLHETMSRAEIDALIEKKRAEKKQPTPPII